MSYQQGDGDMDIHDIICLEKENTNQIFIYQDGDHYKAYECSAYFLTRLLTDCNIKEEECENSEAPSLLFEVVLEPYFREMLPVYLTVEDGDNCLLLKSRSSAMLAFPFNKWRKEYERMKAAQEKRLRTYGRGIFGFVTPKKNKQ
jgi:hypothetical protein